MRTCELEQSLIAGKIVSFRYHGKNYFIQPENNKGWDYLGLWREDGFPVCIARAFFDVTEGVTADTVRELFAQPCMDGKTLAEILSPESNNMDKITMQQLKNAEEAAWANPHYRPAAEALPSFPFSEAEVSEAAERLSRFAPVIAALFPETEAAGGVIESELTEIPAMRAYLTETEKVRLPGRLFLKRDSDLPVAGSVKARGGIYEVLKHTEELALGAGILTGWEDDYKKLITPESRAFFAGYKMQVGSTGNLGMSIGIMSAALGYRAIVHMSADAKQWKKDLLRSRGVTVIEYEGDYGEAVACGRRQSEADPTSYFVDDENSKDLFFGYAVAGRRLAAQLAAQNITVDAQHPLYVYLPCGVGGAPGGICYGLKLVFGDNARCYFVEPTQSPCMLLGLVSGQHENICVQDIGLTGKTAADGLAVGRPSKLISAVAEPLLSGAFTVSDERLEPWLRALWQTEGLFIEPSSCAAFQGVRLIGELEETTENAVHIAWATGGRLVPADLRKQWLEGQG